MANIKETTIDRIGITTETEIEVETIITEVEIIITEVETITTEVGVEIIERGILRSFKAFLVS